MKSEKLALIGGLLFQSFQELHSLSCGSNSIGIDWTGSSSSASGSSSSSASFQSSFTDDECPQDVCAAAEYDIDFSLTVNNFLGFEWWDWTWDGSFSVDGAFCGDTTVCDSLAGGQDSCKAINFAFQQWYPTSCDADSDYDATTIDYNITYKYGCCSTDLCNEDYNFGSCDYNEEFGDYVSELYECWNGVREDSMKYLICDSEGNRTYHFQGNCRDDNGEWTNEDNCGYIHECTEEWETILTNFGECACDAATENGYSGAVIAEIMETQWNTYCPNINLTCSSDGALELFIAHWYLYWTFYVNHEPGYITSTVRQQILNAIAAAGNIDVDLVLIYNEEVIDGADGNETTKFTITISTERETDAATVYSNIESDGEDQIYTDTGLFVTDSNYTTEEESEEVYSGSSGENSGVISRTHFNGIFCVLAIISVALSVAIGV